MNYLDIMDITASGLQAGRRRMNVIAENIANAETTQTVAGGPYRRKLVILRQRDMTQGPRPPLRTSRGLIYQPQGVAVVDVVGDPSPWSRVYHPGHPDADADGYVDMPNVEISLEMVDLLSAAEAYEANAGVLEVVGKTIGEMINLLR